MAALGALKDALGMRFEAILEEGNAQKWPPAGWARGHFLVSRAEVRL
jgi:hypothetical protein